MGLNQPLSLQPSGCSSPERDEDDPYLWRSGTKSLQPSGPPSPERRLPAGAAPEDYFNSDGVRDLLPSAGSLLEGTSPAEKLKQRAEMMELIKQLWSKPISVAQPGGDAARMARISLDNGAGGVSGGRVESLEVPASPRMTAGTVTGEQVADLTRQATGRMRAKTVFSKSQMPQSSQG